MRPMDDYVIDRKVLERIVDEIIKEASTSSETPAGFSMQRERMISSLDDSINFAIFNSLSDDKLREVNVLLDNEKTSQEEFLAFFQKSNIDLSKVISDAILRFRDTYIRKGRDSAKDTARDSVKDMSTYCTYLGHSGFLIEMPEATLLFDWCDGDLPSLRADKPVYVFISHVHADHFQDRALELALRYPQVQIFLGYDYDIESINTMLDQLPDVTRESLSCFNGEQKLISDNEEMVVNTLQSTDMGVAFFVEIGGKTIFHAGDLFLMQTLDRSQHTQWAADMVMRFPKARLESYEEYLETQRALFIRYTEPLRGKTIDYGMIPVDPRFEGIGYQTVKRYMDITSFKAWSPMHMWGRDEFADEFAAAHPEYASNMIAPTRRNQVMKQIRVDKKFRLFDSYGQIDQSKISDVAGQLPDGSEQAEEVYRSACSYLAGWIRKQDINKALTLLNQAANMGNSKAMNLLGKIYYAGKAVQKDAARAFELQNKAACLGNSNAMCWTGIMYEYGYGTEKNYTKALEWYQKAAEHGESDAMFHIGRMYYYGHGVAQYNGTALGWFLKAASLGSSKAMNWVGFMYENGYGAEKDCTKALEWYQKASHFGNANAKKNKERMEKGRKQ